MFRNPFRKSSHKYGIDHWAEQVVQSTFTSHFTVGTLQTFLEHLIKFWRFTCSNEGCSRYKGWISICKDWILFKISIRGFTCSNEGYSRYKGWISKAKGLLSKNKGWNTNTVFELQIQGESGCQFNPRILMRVGLQETRIDLLLIVRVGQIKMQSFSKQGFRSEINWRGLGFIKQGLIFTVSLVVPIVPCDRSHQLEWWIPLSRPDG